MHRCKPRTILTISPRCREIAISRPNFREKWAAGDVNGDGVDDIITGLGAGVPPHVKVFDGGSLGLLHSFFAYGPGFTGGVYVAGIPARPIPEPSTLTLVAVGLIGIASRTRAQKTPGGAGG